MSCGIQRGLDLNMKCVNTFLENDCFMLNYIAFYGTFGHLANIKVLLGQGVRHAIVNLKVEILKDGLIQL